jgi:BASS family bile acid:Na+ symporter
MRGRILQLSLPRPEGRRQLARTEVSSPLPFWFTLFAAAAIFAVMLSLGLLLGREQIAAALQRRMVIGAILFAVVVPVPALAVLFVKLLGLKGPVAAGIVLMSISPGAPVALRRAIEVGGHARFAPALHLAIVLFAVVTVPLSIVILDVIFDKDFTVTPLQIARQVFVAQLLPLGIGAAIRGFLPAAAAWLEPRLARFANLLLLAFLFVCLYTLWPMLVETGWVPVIAGLVLTVCALFVGAAFAGRDAAARPSAAVAAAMRNPGLALLIATVNHAPSSVTAAVFSYALGAVAVVTAFVAWRGSKQRSSRPGQGGP